MLKFESESDLENWLCLNPTVIFDYLCLNEVYDTKSTYRLWRQVEFDGSGRPDLLCVQRTCSGSFFWNVIELKNEYPHIDHIIQLKRYSDHLYKIRGSLGKCHLVYGPNHRGLSDSFCKTVAAIPFCRVCELEITSAPRIECYGRHSFDNLFIKPSGTIRLKSSVAES